MQETPSQTSRAALLLVIANVVGIAIGFAITILLARSLSHDGFKQYIGTVATLGIFASLAEGGFGKYGLKVIPAFIANQNANLLAGYLRFALIGTLITSLVLGIIAASIEIPMRTGDAEKVILLGIVFLPAMAGVGVTVDLLLAFRMATTATMIARILVPLTTQITPFRAILSLFASKTVSFASKTVYIWGQWGLKSLLSI